MLVPSFELIFGHFDRSDIVDLLSVMNQLSLRLRTLAAQNRRATNGETRIPEFLWRKIIVRRVDNLVDTILVEVRSDLSTSGTHFPELELWDRLAIDTFDTDTLVRIAAVQRIVSAWLISHFILFENIY
jgi:hypothetical protein